MSKKSSVACVAARRKQLSQYRCLLREIREEKLYLAQLTNRLLRHAPTLPDGLPLLPEETAARRERLEANLEKCHSLLAEIESYINAIEDSQLRRIFTLRYVHAYSWRRVAYLTGGHEESYARKKHDRYLAKNP